MKIYKYFLIILLFFFSTCLIFTHPGVNEFELFYKYQSTHQASLLAGLVRFTPAIYTVFDIISKTSIGWQTSKVILFFSYIFTWLAFLYLVKSSKNIFKISLLDTSLAYFSSLSLLLFLSLGYFELLAAPFFLLALSFLIRQKIWAVFFYLLAILFNFTLLIFGPIFFFFFRQSLNHKFLDKTLYTIGFLVIPTIFALTLFYFDNISNPKNHILPFSSVLFSLTFIARYSLTLATQLKNAGNFSLLSISAALIGLISIFSTVLYLFKPFLSFKKRLSYFLYTSLFITLIVGTIFTSNYTLTLITLFTFLYIKLFQQLKNINRFIFVQFLEFCFCILLAFLLFSNSLSEGNLLWLILFSLIIYLIEKNRLKLFAVNLLTFINLFFMHGFVNKVPINGLYFQYFQLIFASFFVLFTCLYIKKTYSKNPGDWLAKFLVTYLVILNISLIPATGTGDIVSYVDTSILNVQYHNPFQVKAIDLQMYPPLHIVIIGIFANIWHFLVRNDAYIYAVKLSIIFFYSLTVLMLIKFNKIMNIRNKQNRLTKSLVILSTFSIVIQTQGLSDVNIHAIPALILAIILLFKKKILLSGIAFGASILIKPQPLLIAPLFVLTLINLKHNWAYSIKKLLPFGMGFLLINCFVWILVLINPGGNASFIRTMTYFFRLDNFGALSGQALNLDWIITYILHLTPSFGVDSLQYLEGINQHVSSAAGPFFSHGIIFYIVGLLIILKYWLLKSKNIIDFLKASIVIFFAHYIVNVAAYEKHLIYTVVFILLLYIAKPTKSHFILLALFDLMAALNLIFFFGITGSNDINRLFFGFDMTVLFAFFYVLIFIWVMKDYFQDKLFAQV